MLPTILCTIIFNLLPIKLGSFVQTLIHNIYMYNIIYYNAYYNVHTMCVYVCEEDPPGRIYILGCVLRGPEMPTDKTVCCFEK